MHIHRNNVNSIPDNSFVGMRSIENLFIGGKNLRFLGLQAFGDRSLSTLNWLNVMSSNLYAIDEQIYNRATNLQYLYLYDNNCVSRNFYQVDLDREVVRQQLAPCFESFVGSMMCQYIVIPGRYFKFYFIS